MMSAQQRIQFIRDTLTQQFSPTFLEVIDQSERHRGHPGSLSGGGHFDVVIAAVAFQGKTLVACHRLIYSALDEIMGKEIHALSIKILPVTAEQ